MSKIKHTPAPYTLKKAYEGTNEGEFIVAILPYGKSGDKDYLIISSEGEAKQQPYNASLFDAAPAMLDALKEAKSYMFCHIYQQIPKGGVLPGKDLLKILENLIAKAEGGSHV